MKGWLYTAPHVAPKLIEKEDPHAGPGEVVVDIKACGLCHSDVGMLENDEMAAVFMKAPNIFGHEGAGIVSEVGEGVTCVKVGDRVGIGSQSPDDPYDIIGCSRDGCYATKTVAPADWCVPLPENVSFVVGAAGSDAGGTSYHALFTLGQAKAGMKVGIIGIGGLGQFAAQMAMIAGCEVYAADTSEEARELAKNIGCANVHADANDLAEDQPNLILDFAGYDATIRAAAASAAPGGVVVIVGMGQAGGKVTINFDDILNKDLTIKGMLGGVKEDVAGVYEYFATGRLHPQLNVIKFEQVGEGLEMLKRGEVKGRLVAEVNE